MLNAWPIKARGLVAALVLLSASPAFAQAQGGKVAPSASRLLPDGTPPLLAGRWGDNGDCKQDVLLREDGTFQSYTGGEGRWSVESDVLTMAGAGGEVRLRVVELERDRMTVENDDGSIGHSQRCDGGVPVTGEAQAQN